MSFATVVALTGLVFSMISISLMARIEKAQIIVVKQIGSNDAKIFAQLRKPLRSRGVVRKKIMAFTIGSRRLLFLRFGATVFARLSSIIFIVESMYPEKAVESALFAAMKTVTVSNRIVARVRKHGENAAEKIKKVRPNYISSRRHNIL